MNARRSSPVVFALLCVACASAEPMSANERTDGGATYSPEGGTTASEVAPGTFDEDVVGVSPLASAHGAQPVVVFIDFTGGSFAPGPFSSDNGRSGRGPAVRSANNLVHAFDGARWGSNDDAVRSQLVNIVREDFLGFPIDVRTEEPSEPVFTRIVVTHDPAQLGLSNEWPTAAPLDVGNSNGGDLAFVFADVLDDGASVIVLGQWVSHALAHTLGLGHDDEGQSMMSMSASSGRRSWSAASYAHFASLWPSTPTDEQGDAGNPDAHAAPGHPSPPFGDVSGFDVHHGYIRAVGWAADNDALGPVLVELLLDGQKVGEALADKAEPVSPVAGVDAAGFSLSVMHAANLSGSHRACIVVRNQGAVTDDVELKCIQFSVNSVASPFGAFDSAARVPGGVRVSGWSIDPDTDAPLSIHVYVDGQIAGSGTADRQRLDVQEVHPGWGANHGYAFEVPLPSAGGTTRKVCTYAINWGGGGNPQLGCKDITSVTHSPFGYMDHKSIEGGSTRVQGWMVDPDSKDPLEAHVYIDGAYAGKGICNGARADVEQVYPGWGTDVGCNFTVPKTGTQVCLYAINVGFGSGNPKLGCK